MKVHLMYPDRDFDLNQTLPPNAQELIDDLALTPLFDAMAQRDEFLFNSARTAILCGISDPGTIVYRQDVLKVFLRSPELAREMYELASETLEARRKNYLGIFTKNPSGVIYQSVRLLQLLMEALHKLRSIADQNRNRVESAGLTALFDMVQVELSDDYLERVRAHLKRFDIDNGMLLRVQLGPGNRGTHYTLVQDENRGPNWLGLVLGRRRGYTFHLSARDEAGHRVLAEMKDRGTNQAANALAQSADHILSFFHQLKAEVAFFVGCLNVSDGLVRIGAPTCFPTPLDARERHWYAQGIYDICLCLNTQQQVVGNDLSADGKDLWVVTGANQGGKSTFLRSVGITQLMMQSGMFVPARSLTANTVEAVFTHFRKEEDAEMNQGKFDEELSRMSHIVDQISPEALLLCNESFAATNEREGSEVARQIIEALVEHSVQVVFVTHLYAFAGKLYGEQREDTLFLRAMRTEEGKRTFRIEPGRPLSTSFGRDLYEEVFEQATTAALEGKQG
ncbi:MutS-related protein [Alicyclobacillus sp. ALC3]|uniref:MutS-related protein n=1 Tax=Alicyclobacillus sp. ALC3 TaxID=2796143 RepID=UPI0023792529|nr:hypothetical protein [Alicyclobacillus sp. ALC3]WDL99782.1 hypothetical protein JC200_23710 [Alicyclobacillus sp. ALC3]